MHPDSQSLESSFTKATGRAPDAPAQSDPVVEDFNTFFEKLSALDDLQWPDDGATAAKPAARKPATAARAAAQPAPPRMTVVQSDRDLGPPPPDAEDADRADDPARNRLTAKDVARFLKLTLVGLVLFALGLGAGWAALSLPGQFEQGLPSVTDLMERVRSVAPVPREAVGASEALRLAPVEAPKAAQNPKNEGASKPAPMAAVRSAKAAKASPTVAAVPQPASSGMSALAEDAADVDDGPRAGAEDDGIQLPVVGRADRAATAGLPSAVLSEQPAAAPAGDGNFALQVGACSSYECVQTYRNLLLRRVSSGRVKVVPPTPSGIQRIRVEPLGRAEAEQLKADLAGMDPRFKDAYLVTLR